MKKICVVTAARSEYGLMRWIIDSIHKYPDLELQLVVTGAHLSVEQGLTYKFIEEDGYPIAAKVDMKLSSPDIASIVRSMGYCSQGFATTFDRLKPDIVVVLGDRYELLPIVSAALVMRFPVAHIAGGDVTEGAIDDEVRNAVTMMSTIHFPGVVAAAENIQRMRGTSKNVFAVGEVGLDSFNRYNLWSKEETAERLNLNLNKKWCLVTFHPETKLSTAENMTMAENLYNAMLKTEGIQYIITKANADFGGVDINNYWTEKVALNKEKMQLYASLGQIRYLSFMKHANMVVGNSSSGIVEAPFMGTPVVNIGDRQKGRHICKNVICCGNSLDEISCALNKAINAPRIVDTYWGDGYSSERIVNKIKEYLHA
jgi:UDP-hydrolysing UDP-N-acetyl-D-glucosamine 2-epimerase